MEEWFGQIAQFILEFMNKIESVDLIQSSIHIDLYIIMDVERKQLQFKSEYRNSFLLSEFEFLRYILCKQIFLKNFLSLNFIFILVQIF